MGPEEKKKQSAEASKRWRARNRGYGSRWRKKNIERDREQKRKWAKANPEKIRSKTLKHQYGITLEQYHQMLLDQGGGCAICGSKVSGCGDNAFHVDHDHATGKVRGILCHRCNLGLSHFKDNPDFLRLAIAYLENKKAAHF